MTKTAAMPASAATPTERGVAPSWSFSASLVTMRSGNVLWYQLSPTNAVTVIDALLPGGYA